MVAMRTATTFLPLMAFTVKVTCKSYRVWFLNKLYPRSRFYNCEVGFFFKENHVNIRIFHSGCLGNYFFFVCLNRFRADKLYCNKTELNKVNWKKLILIKKYKWCCPRLLGFKVNCSEKLLSSPNYYTVVLSIKTHSTNSDFILSVVIVICLNQLKEKYGGNSVPNLVDPLENKSCVSLSSKVVIGHLFAWGLLYELQCGDGDIVTPFYLRSCDAFKLRVVG